MRPYVQAKRLLLKNTPARFPSGPILQYSCLSMLCLALSACYSMRGSSGGGETEPDLPRVVNANDIAVPSGYHVELVATGFTYPTGCTFDDQGRLYVVESGYSYGEVWTTPRLLRVNGDNTTTEIARGEKNGPWTGAVFHNGVFFVSEGGELQGGRILKITPDGNTTVLVENLPSMGDHHTNGPVVGPDGWIYFGQGTATNSAIVGEDNYRFGWLSRNPDFHDIPCEDITLTGQNFTSSNPLGKTEDAMKQEIETGPYLPFGTKASEGQLIPGQIPCNGSVLRVRPDGGEVELVAWGFRNPFAVAFHTTGDLYCLENGYDERGSRPVFGAGDLLWKVERGRWHGWPDYMGELPLDSTYENHAIPDLSPVIAQHPNEPPRPAAILAVHGSADGLDFSRAESFGHVGEAFVSLFGDMAPDVGKVLNSVGFKVVRIDVSTGVVRDFMVNKGETNAPASKLKTGGLERPVSVRFDPGGRYLYVVDFGIMTVGKKGPEPKQRTGVIWRVSHGQEARR